jgi:hypothetical protein
LANRKIIGCVLQQKISAMPLTKDEYDMAVEHITKDFATLLRYVQNGSVRIEMNGQIKR